MPRDFFPRQLGQVLSWSQNFASKIQAAPGDYSLTPEQAAQYALKHDRFAALWQATQDPRTRTRPAIEARNASLVELEAEARQLARIVRAAPGVTSAMRINLRLSVADAGGRGSPTHAPEHAPGLSITQVVGRTIHVRLRDSSAPRRGKPDGVAGAILYRYVGEHAPVSLSEWFCEGVTTRTTAEVHFGPEVPAGAKVWVCACWLSPRAATGPGAAPASAHLQDGVVTAKFGVAHRAAA